MSSWALLKATEDHLKVTVPTGQYPNSTLGIGIVPMVRAANIGIRPPPGRPPAIADEQYVAIWSESVSNISHEGLQEEYNIKITVSVRAPVKPDDRYGDLMTQGMLTSSTRLGIYPIVELVRASLHLNYDVTSRANTYINTAVTNFTSGAITAANGFVEPLYLQNIGSVETKGGSWFVSSNKERAAALTCTLTFSPAVRLQYADQMT